MSAVRFDHCPAWCRGHDTVAEAEEVTGWPLGSMHWSSPVSAARGVDVLLYASEDPADTPDGGPTITLTGLGDHRPLTLPEARQLAGLIAATVGQA